MIAHSSKLKAQRLGLRHYRENRELLKLGGYDAGMLGSQGFFEASSKLNAES
jgi:hypothetical protein